MSFLRPEAKAEIWRWREVLVGVTAATLGLWLVAGPGLLLAIPGYALIAGGAGLVWLGIQRGRFRGPGGGTGAVQVDEEEITYFGPLSGGSVALRDMDRLSLERQMFPAHWRLDQSGKQPLFIPVNAEGSEALFDAFAVLPGIRTERMLFELRKTQHDPVVIWERPPLRPANALLH